MTTNEETIKYELSNDQQGLMRFCIAFDQNGEEDRFTYHVHSDELTRLEKWIHGLLIDRAASKDAPRRMPPALLPEERETGKLRYPLAPNACPNRTFAAALARL